MNGRKAKRLRKMAVEAADDPRDVARIYKSMKRAYMQLDWKEKTIVTSQ